MKAQISFRFINPDYSQEYADQYNGGKESESNWKYNEQFTRKIENIISVELINPGTFHLIGNFANKNIDIQIPNITIFRCFYENGTHEDFAVSKSVLNKAQKTPNEKYQIIRCYFYINSEPKSIKFGENLVLGVNELPDELKNSEFTNFTQHINNLYNDKRSNLKELEEL